MTSPIPANDFRALWADLGEDALDAVRRVGESGWYVLGKEVEAFEADLAAFHGLEHVVGVASGLDAIEIALRAAGIGPGDGVLTTPLTAFATALAVLRAGATPVFADVDEFGLLDLDAAAEVLRGDDSIRAIVPVHLYGHAVEMPRVHALAAEHDLVVIEDAAQAIRGRWDGAPHGTGSHSAATSFYPTKNLGALGDGGALLTNDSDVARLARQLRDYGQQAKYEHVVPGLNSRLDELHAAVLRTAVLPRLGGALDARAATAQRYLDGISNERLRVEAPANPSTWHLFPVFVREAAERESFREHLSAAGIGTAIHYPILASAQQALPAPQPADAFPTADRLARTEVSLPIHPYLSGDEIDRVIEACNAW